MKKKKVNAMLDSDSMTKYQYNFACGDGDHLIKNTPVSLPFLVLCYTQKCSTRILAKFNKHSLLKSQLFGLHF